MSSSLNGRRALVTAGASGIGRVISQRLIEAGARCMVCDVEAAALDEYASASGAGLAVRADVADEAQVAVRPGRSATWRYRDPCQQRRHLRPTLPAEELSLGDWCLSLAVNLDGHFLRSRRAGAWDDIVGALDPARCCKLNDPSGTNIGRNP
jgi:NAD(P)-dependent dehydrogenase (short-subunit alcohol dehydrogenase family)